MINVLGMEIIYPDIFTVIVITAISLSAVSIYISRRVNNPKKAEELKKRIEEHQKKYLEAQKAGDKKALDRLEAEQAEIMNQVKENMYNSMKPMFITTPLVLVILWLFGTWYGSLGPIIGLPFGIPFLTKQFMEMHIQNGVDWLGLYIITAIIASLAVQALMKWYEKRRENQ